MQASSETALEVLQSTWVASEVVWFWVTLVAAWWFLGRVQARREEPELGPLAGFDLPDAWIGVVIAGMAGVLLGRQLDLNAVAVIGWNLVFGAGFVFAVRGVAVQTFWMERAGWRRPVRTAVLGIGFLLALPVFLIMGAGLGLFDAWFDFRRIRGAQAGE
ncbi:MAG: DUF2232 domain-containing protein [Gemmatimonadetes bacterium]|nr:DUF2232 domain-containing protein [Gemmatimonadota bacterium]